VTQRRRRTAIEVAVCVVILAALGLVNGASRPATPPSGPGVSIEQHLGTGHTTATVAVIGDFGFADAAEAAVASLVAEWSPDAVVSVGDDYYAEAGGTGLDRYDRTIGAYYCAFLHGAYAGARCPSGGTADENRFWSAAGNHDYGAAGIDVYAGYLPFPGNKRWFSVRIGAAEMFILDSDLALRDSGEMAAERAWLQTAAAASTARWKVAVFHQPPYTSGNRHGSSVGMRWPFDAMGINLVLNGHEHVYERVLVDGVTYVVDGLGGAGRYGFGKPVAGSVTRYADDWGALRVDITLDSLRGTFISVDGVTRDTVRLAS
jgi:tartrate-resistant acid phosphatase type 5